MIATRVTGLGEFLPIGRFFAYWAIFRLLGDFSPIRRLLSLYVMFSENTEAAKLLGKFFRGKNNA
jgi:hypothetical protein